VIWTTQDLERWRRAEAKLVEVRRRLREDPDDEMLLIEEIRLHGTCAAYWWHVELAREREWLASRWN
jgi:hypothetical protein